MATQYLYWNLWSTPLFVAEDPNHAQIRDAAMSQLLEWFEEHPEPRPDAPGSMIKGGLLESDFRFFDAARKKDQRELLQIEDFMRSQLRHSFYDFFSNDFWTHRTSERFADIDEEDLEVEVCESWAHLTRHGGYHGEHIHPMHSWGAIYYLDVGTSNSEHGNNVFRQPFGTNYHDFGNFFQADHELFSLPPENGKCLFFPCNIGHAANAYYGDESKPRAVIAMNARIFHRSRK